MSNDLNQNEDFDLGLDLKGAASRLRIPAGSMDAVMERATRRSHRRRRAVATITTLGVVAVTAGGINLAGRGDDGTPLVTAGGVIRGESGLTWRQVAPASALGFATPSDGTGPVYALSTAAGQTDFGKNYRQNSVVWRSDDGVEWSAASALGDDLYLSDLATRDSRVYAVGTGPATAAVGAKGVVDLMVGWSDDGAKSFQRNRLPLDTAAIAAKSIRSGVTDTEVATGPTGTVAVAKLYSTLNVRALLPAGVTAPNGWTTSATGVDLLGPGTAPACPATEGQGATATTVVPRGGDPRPGEIEPTWCGDENGMTAQFGPQEGRGVTASYTWAQLGVDGDLLRAVLGQPVAFFAPAGSTAFERVELPGLSGISPGPVVLESGDEGFDLLVGSGGAKPGDPRSTTMTVLHSDDGRAWTDAGQALGGLGWSVAAGRLNGRLTVVGDSEAGAVVVRSDGAGGWTTSPLSAAVDPDTIAGRFHVYAAGVGPLGIVVVGATAPEVQGRNDVNPPVRLLVSRDGVTWSDQSVEELAGQPVAGVTRVSIEGQRAIVTANLPRPGGPSSKPSPSKQIALVGTPS